MNIVQSVPKDKVLKEVRQYKNNRGMSFDSMYILVYTDDTASLVYGDVMMTAKTLDMLEDVIRPRGYV